MASKALPSQEVLRQLLRYEPDTGKLFWRSRGPEWFTDDKQAREHNAAIWNSRFAGAVAISTAGSDGYLRGPVLGKIYAAHRVIWKMVHGSDPDFIDHIDGNRQNNRISNLRSITQTENNRNMCLRSTNRSGVMGVRWHRQAKKWQVNIAGKYLGLFDDFETAVKIRSAAEAERGYHPNNGRRP